MKIELEVNSCKECPCLNVHNKGFITMLTCEDNFKILHETIFEGKIDKRCKFLEDARPKYSKGYPRVHLEGSFTNHGEKPNVKDKS